MSSLPTNTSTPAASSISIGGMVSPPAPWVTSATPASAIVSAASATAVPVSHRQGRVIIGIHEGDGLTPVEDRIRKAERRPVGDDIERHRASEEHRAGFGRSGR